MSGFTRQWPSGSVASSVIVASSHDLPSVLLASWRYPAGVTRSGSGAPRRLRTGNPLVNGNTSPSRIAPSRSISTETRSAPLACL